jgi:hypothetical protein
LLRIKEVFIQAKMKMTLSERRRVASASFGASKPSYRKQTVNFWAREAPAPCTGLIGIQ